MTNLSQDDLIKMTADLVAAYVSSNPVPAAGLPSLLSDVFVGLAKLVIAAAPAEPAQPPVPVVPIKKSITDDYLICLEDGKRFKSLKRHLTASYGMTAEQYRTKWGLSKDYPMVAPAYAAKRSQLAKDLGLGRPALNGEGKIAAVRQVA